jgi:hypothetical protein
VVSFTPRPLNPQGKSPWYPLDRRVGGPQGIIIIIIIIIMIIIIIISIPSDWNVIQKDLKRITI